MSHWCVAKMGGELLWPTTAWKRTLFYSIPLFTSEFLLEEDCYLLSTKYYLIYKLQIYLSTVFHGPLLAITANSPTQQTSLRHKASYCHSKHHHDVTAIPLCERFTVCTGNSEIEPWVVGSQGVRAYSTEWNGQSPGSHRTINCWNRH